MSLVPPPVLSQIGGQPVPVEWQRWFSLIPGDILAHITIADVIGLTAALAAKLSTTLANDHILIGNASNLAASVAVSGDVTLDNTGVATVASRFGGWTNPISVPYTAFNYTGGVSSFGFVYGSVPFGTLVHFVKMRVVDKFIVSSTPAQVQIATGKIDLTDGNNYTPLFDVGDVWNGVSFQCPSVNDMPSLTGPTDLTATLICPSAGALDVLTAGEIEISLFVSRSA